MCLIQRASHPCPTGGPELQCSTVKKLDYWGRCRVLKFLSQGTGLIHFFENVFEQELVLLEKERS